MSSGSTDLDGGRVRRDQLGQPAGGDDARLDAELLPDGRDDSVHLTREAVDEPGLERRGGRAADRGRRLDEVHLDESGGALEERLHRDLDPRREHAADVLALGRHDVEVRRRSEVDDDARRAVALLRGDRVGDAVRAHLARVVVANGDAGPDARPHHEQRRLRPPLGEHLVLADERRHRRGEADAVDRREVDEAADERAELVAGAVGLGRDPPVLGEPAVVESPKTVWVLPTSIASSTARF